MPKASNGGLFAIAFKLKSPVSIGLVVLGSLFIFAACSSRGDSPPGPEEVIWEAWTVVNESYVDASSLDADVVVGGVISGMLNFAEKPSYPFLT